MTNDHNLHVNKIIYLSNITKCFSLHSQHQKLVLYKDIKGNHVENLKFLLARMISELSRMYQYTCILSKFVIDGLSLSWCDWKIV
jgi:hypothetical protein